MRAISTVVDVAVFLLFISAAVATLTVAPPPDQKPVVVDDRAALLAASTADIEYSVRASERTAHGTVGSLLARAAVVNATIDGRIISAGHEEYCNAVSNATRRTIGPSDQTQVLVRWEPYRDAPVHGVVQVGAGPPAGRDVTVATLTVPAPVGPRFDAKSRTDDGFQGVAAVTARATAAALLAPGPETLPSGGVSPASASDSRRLRTLADATGVSIDRLLARGNVSEARERVVAGLATRYEQDMREQFDSPNQAARAVSVGTVRITVRRWEP